MWGMSCSIHGDVWCSCPPRDGSNYKEPDPLRDRRLEEVALEYKRVEMNNTRSLDVLDDETALSTEVDALQTKVEQLEKVLEIERISHEVHLAEWKQAQQVFMSAEERLGELKAEIVACRDDCGCDSQPGRPLCHWCKRLNALIPGTPSERGESKLRKAVTEHFIAPNGHLKSCGGACDPDCEDIRAALKEGT